MTLTQKYLKLVILVNRAKTQKEWLEKNIELSAWKKGVADCGRIGAINYCAADMFYLTIGSKRPMCCGLFLDWGPVTASE